MLAYHNDPTLKADMLAEMALHREAEKIAQGHYWDDDGTGCAVGCAVQTLNLRRGLALEHGDHDALAKAVNWPVRLWYLVDKLFELQKPDAAKVWPERVLNAVGVGADLSLVVDRWLLDLLEHLPPQTRPDVVASIAGVKELLTRRLNGDEPTSDEWRAKRAAADAADADAYAAYAADAAADAADADAYAAAAAAADAAAAYAAAAAAADAAAAYAAAAAADAARWHSRRQAEIVRQCDALIAILDASTEPRP